LICQNSYSIKKILINVTLFQVTPGVTLNNVTLINIFLIEYEF